MRMKIFMTVVTLLLVFSATAQVARAQKDGEAQVVSFDQNNWATKGSRSGGAKPCSKTFAWSVRAKPLRSNGASD